ncbi:hypothetical protein VNO77_22317 [Canavalia gladiata]|uniref:ATP-dependent DNA helicase n=1 Tax=Canavalia gladiata TaxID=3824 RepID=A0AAN9L2D1_CANGL
MFSNNSSTFHQEKDMLSFAINRYKQQSLQKTIPPAFNQTNTYGTVMNDVNSNPELTNQISTVIMTPLCDPMTPDIGPKRTSYLRSPLTEKRIRDVVSNDPINGAFVEHVNVCNPTTVVYTIEFQKRGLPHAHILVFFHSTSKYLILDQIDSIICAEIPDEKVEPELRNIVETLMIHGPCGAQNRKSPCMHNVQKDKVSVDNRYVVPYNKYLLLKYNAHINVEWCNQSRSIKYLFKYVNKGHDRVIASFYQNGQSCSKENTVDEIKLYYDCRYLSSCEAVWRIFAYDIHYREPFVERLSFHLPDQHAVVFQDDDTVDDIANRPSSITTKFLVWMEANKKYDEGRTLTYAEFPTKFVWKQSDHEWTIRKRGFSIGKLHFVPPGSDRKARNSTCIYLSDDILYRQRQKMQQPDLQLTDVETYNLALYEIQKLLERNNRTLSEYPSMPQPEIEFVSDFNNRLIMDELQYDKEKLASDHLSFLTKMTDEQMNIYNKIMESVDVGRSKIFFLYRYGGTRKTFLWKSISAGIRSKGDIVLTVASSGIAALLLPGGRTTHSRTFRDILRFSNPHSLNKPFGGKVIVFCGDFRQILPVIPKGSKQDVVHASINSSYLWEFCEVLTLTKNMRKQNISQFCNASNMNEHSIRADDIHTSKILNTINCSGLPNHEIKLKIGVPIILLRNIDQTSGMCNGTRLVITQMGNYILEAKVISGNNVGEKVFIPRLSLTPSDSRIPFKFQRRQFPIALSFAMTINKSQGQSLTDVGIYIPKSFFSHSQLYVAVSRVTNKKGLKLLITDEEGNCCGSICNVVCKEVFRNV